MGSINKNIPRENKNSIESEQFEMSIYQKTHSKRRLITRYIIGGLILIAIGFGVYFSRIGNDPQINIQNINKN